MCTEHAKHNDLTKHLYNTCACVQRNPSKSNLSEIESLETIVRPFAMQIVWTLAASVRLDGFRARKRLLFSVVSDYFFYCVFYAFTRATRSRVRRRLGRAANQSKAFDSRVLRKGTRAIISTDIFGETKTLRFLRASFARFQHCDMKFLNSDGPA